MRCENCGEELSPSYSFCPSCGRELPKTITPNRYQVKQPLGKGGNGVVYEAFDTQANRSVAIKALNAQWGADKSTIARFFREARISLSLRHSNIIEAYEFGEASEGQLWLVMELLRGETLQSYLNHAAPISPLTLMALLGPICRGLEEAHQRGVVHRDIKPANVMLVKSAKGHTPKLLDFGLSSFREASILTDSSSISGTPRYMAPEQWNGLKFATRASDIYSLGMICYYALSKRYPFEADTALAWMKKHSTEEPVELNTMLPRPLPKAASASIMKALSKKPEERPSSATAFFDEVCEGFDELFSGSDTTPDSTLKNN